MADTIRLSETLQDNVAIVTGSARGIGKEIALKLLHSGAKVLICGTEDDYAEKTAQELKALTNGEVKSFTGDLSQEKNVDNLVQYTLDCWGKIDILVNNAGGGVILPFLAQTPKTLEATINRNLWTTIWCCYKALPHMVQQKYGRIINIGADSVRNGLWDHAAYNAAKGGVHALTTGLAREFAEHDITVNTVAPPAVDCEGLDRIRERDAALVDKYIEIIPKGRAAHKEEVADAVWYLATKGASFVTGQVISVNGGSNML